MKTLLNIIIAVTMILTGVALTLIAEMIALWRHLKEKNDGKE